MAFKYIDLFAGIGGFHHALSEAGGECVFVSEIDAAAQRVYELNWGDDIAPRGGRPLIEGDIIPLTDPEVLHVPDHDVLAAGFPCQPFSKSGFQHGINETRGTLFFNIAKILEAKRPRAIVLENVRNLAGPRHAETWATIIRTLRDLGYRVSDTPTVFSPHLLPKSHGGTPQVRDRVFIVGEHVGRERAWAEADSTPTLERRPLDGWDPQDWNLDRDVLLDESEVPEKGSHVLSDDEVAWIDVWDDFVTTMLEVREGVQLPGFPIWADEFVVVPRITASTPAWKANFLRKNSQFYVEHREAIDAWKARHDGLKWMPASRRKLEWQAQDESSLWSCAMHLRPSGIRAKKTTYLPALVAITQTSIIGPRRRRITVREAARLQGLPDSFTFGTQPDAASFKQLGNGVSAGVVSYVLRASGILDRLNADSQPQVA
ncbi:DNA cytosine methyltransferase [Demequina sp. NBRC 110051]|uniref:DNA cytosine methyltransferase n=1 Tax=Demequina sp. NBRC 110051 TaxID=1570340 RepID=UPI000A03E80B|nr:DNA cytosine methyltransferase [Demequina sp. NBRC 110051]